MAQRKKGQRKPKTEIQRSEEQFQRFVARRNEFNNESRMLRDERDALHEQRHKVMVQILALREEMKSNSRAKGQSMQARDQLRKQAHKLIAAKKAKGKSGRGSGGLLDTVQALMSEIMASERRLETTEMSIARERALLERISILRRSLSEQQVSLEEQEHLHAEVSELDESIDTRFSEADQHHQEVVRLAKLNSKLYDKMTEMMQEASHLSGEADKKHQVFVEIHQRADHQHQRAMEMLDHLRQHRKVTREEQQAGWKQVRDRHQAVKQALYDDTKLAEAADDAIKELMAGGKISL